MSRKCELCDVRPTFAMPGERARFCGTHRAVGMVDVKNKKCELCDVQPTFAMPGERARFCGTHREVGMVNIKDKTCELCDVKPSFAMPGERARFCGTHRAVGMVNVINKTCELCDVQPTFAMPGEQARFCGNHREDGMVDVINKKCELCNTKPAFALPGERARFCGTHRAVGMVNVNAKTCELCDARPSFAMPGERARFCGKHRTINMVDVKHKTCELEVCSEIAYYGSPGWPVTRCSEHKRDGDIKNSNKRCSDKSCREPAVYGKVAAERCETHKLPDDANFVEHPCKSCNLTWRLSEEGICAQCSEHAVVKLAKQREIKDVLAAQMPEFPPDCYDRITPALKRLGDRERPDFFFDRGSYCVILEVDEHGHKDRAEACECTRMVNICQAEQRPTYFLRYNPDGYQLGDGRKFTKKRRHDLLVRCLREVLTKQPSVGPLAVKRLFFDGFKEEDAAVWTVIAQM